MLSALALCALAAGSACGRQNVELYPGARGSVAEPPLPSGGSTSQPSEPELCQAAVPPGLLFPRPPMGWNGFNSFACTKTLDDQKVRDIADVLASSGMQAVGYRYVDLDDCWELPRGETGDIAIDPVKLPSGMAALGAHLHDRGFQFGVFRAAGDCPKTPAEHYVQDAASYLTWGIDLLKFVTCSSDVDGQADAERMASALAANGRPILLSLADPPFSDWMTNVAQTFRTNSPIHPTWASILANLDANAPLAPYARPGAFNDPDMLEVGNGTLTESEQRSHFSLWSVLSAPLLAGNDLTTMSEPTRAILTNPEVIALDQDPLGLQGALVRDDGSLQIFAKPLEGCGARGVVLFNRSETVVSTTLKWSEIWLATGRASARDLWAHQDLGSWDNELDLSVQPHDVLALRVVGAEPPAPRGAVPLGDAPWTYAANFFGPVERNTSNGEDVATDGLPLQIGDQPYASGLGVHAPSLLRFRLGGACTHFSAQVGLDKEVAGAGSVVFQVWADGEKLFDSGTLTGTSAALPVDVSLEGRQDLRLFVGALGDTAHDHADWAEPQLICDE
jgi:alpha-galactosidase